MTESSAASDKPTHVVMFSGGVVSWAAAKRVAERYGTGGMVLLFADTRIEDEDLYRFLEDAAANVGVPVTRVADGRTPWEVFRDHRFLGNTRVDLCSRILKRELLDTWVKNHCDPDATTLYFGFSWDEAHRAKRTRERLAAWHCDFPMVDWRPLIDARAWASSEGLRLPRLYAMGFQHNNCGGFCVKAGQGRFALLYRTLPERYRWHERQEELLRAELGEVAILRDRTGGTTRPLSLREFRQRLEQGDTGTLFDDVACSCMDEVPQ